MQFTGGVWQRLQFCLIGLITSWYELFVESLAGIRMRSRSYRLWVALLDPVLGAGTFRDWHVSGFGLDARTGSYTCIATSYGLSDMIGIMRFICHYCLRQMLLLGCQGGAYCLYKIHLYLVFEASAWRAPAVER